MKIMSGKVRYVIVKVPTLGIHAGYLRWKDAKTGTRGGKRFDRGGSRLEVVKIPSLVSDDHSGSLNWNKRSNSQESLKPKRGYPETGYIAKIE